jgi:transposase
MSIIQYMENYTDRQAPEALKTRIDFKYALSLELTDPGFDFSVLSEFRSRLIKGGLEEVLLTTLLTICQESGLLKERGKQRTDSTHIEAAIRNLNRIECVGETLRATLNSLAVVVPDWLRAHVPQEWYDRYEKRMEAFRMPKEATKRGALVEQIGRDGFDLLKWVREADAPSWLREIPAAEILRQVWLQQFWVEEGHIQWRSNENIPPASHLISSPYDTQAHMSIKRDTIWTVYKVHLTETCDDQAPHLIIHVETTSATTQDMEMTTVIHQELECKQLLPCHASGWSWLASFAQSTGSRAYSSSFYRLVSRFSLFSWVFWLIRFSGDSSLLKPISSSPLASFASSLRNPWALQKSVPHPLLMGNVTIVISS